jgi:murein DD-endopeptidase MepM/ murein hydrolase activator NlpD
MNPSRTIDLIDVHGRKLRALFAVLAVITAIFMLALALSTIKIDDNTQPVSAVAPADSTTASMSDDPNVIAGGLAMAADSFKQAVDGAGASADNGMRTVELKTVRGAQAIVQSGVTIAQVTQHGVVATTRGVGKGATLAAGFTVHTAGNTLAFVATAPGNIVSIIPAMFSTVPSVSALIRPAEQATIPIIDPVLSAAFAAQTDGSASLVAKPSPADKPTAPAAQPAADTSTQWPIHGMVTTQFGVPELPYQVIHTGLDISDGNRPGVTPIKAIKVGRVVQVVHSALGLGNHVVIDHGGGLTSVYGHMYSIAVQEGQQVDKNTLLGTEGSTGVSTGTHLHFETRVNGQAVNPHQFITGQP